MDNGAKPSPTEAPWDEPTVEEAKEGEHNILEPVTELNLGREDSTERTGDNHRNDDRIPDNSIAPTACKQAIAGDPKEAKVSPSREAEKASTTIATTVRTEESVEADQYNNLEPTTNAGPLSDIDDEELLSALRSLQVDEETNNYSQDEDFDIPPSEQGVLEELQVDPEDQELVPLQDFSNLFEDTDAIDDTIAALQDNLNRLNIYQDPHEMDELNDEGEDFPDYLLCRPCHPEMEDPISIQMGQLQCLSEEELLQLSLQGMADGSHIIDGENENTREQQVYEDSFQSFVVSRRREAVEAAISYTRAFGTGLYQPPLENGNPVNERTCFGHEETVYCVQFSECGRFLASASQDAAVCVWDVKSNALLSKLKGHDKEHECLRVAWAPTNWSASNGDEGSMLTFLESTGEDKVSNPSFIASGGADGVVKVWLSPDPSEKGTWECVSTLDHASFQGTAKAPQPENGNVDTPQIYVLQFIEHWQGLAPKGDENNSFLMTSSDNYIHLWDMDDEQKVGSSEISFSEVFSLRFTAAENVGGGVAVCTVTKGGLKVSQEETSPNNTSGQRAYGGDRNPHNIIYVFDASYCPGNGLLGVALSDGTLRLVNGRGVCVSVLSLPGYNSHLTSFTWDSTGSRLASCVATGHLILWKIHGEDENGRFGVSCVAVLEGGHVPGRPLFGARYCGVDNEDLIVSWGVDGRLCLWDSFSHGQIHAPISTLISRQDYPIYAVDIASTKDDKILSRVAVGGGLEAGFLGVPLYLYDVERMPADSFNRGKAAVTEDATETAT